MDFFTNPLQLKAFYSLTFLVLLFCLKIAIGRTLAQSQIESALLRQRWLKQIEYSFTFSAILGAVIIWAEQFHAFLLCFFALIVIVLFVTKELILCVLGSVLKARTISFSVGDHITIGKYRGIIANQTLLATTLHLIGPNDRAHQFTGKTIMLPNSLFLNNCILNERSNGSYRIHTFSVKCNRLSELQSIKDFLQNEMEDFVEEYHEESLVYLKRKFPKSDLSLKNTAPRIFLSETDGESGTLSFQLPVISDKADLVEQELLHKYCQFISELKLIDSESKKNFWPYLNS